MCKPEELSKEFEDRTVTLHGYNVTVWSKRSPIISVNGFAGSFDGISDMVDLLKESVEGTCHHENSKPLPYRHKMLHEYKCLDCGARWGYDSSD